MPERIYTFKHALTREVAYQSLLTRTRQELHRNIAEVLETRFPDTVSHQPELLAEHYTEAGLPESAIDYWLQAGQRAIVRSANSEAIAHLSKGLKVLETLPPSPERAEDELRLQLSHDPCVCGHSTAALILWVLGYPDKAVKRNDKALEQARKLDHPSSTAAAVKGAAELYQVRREQGATTKHAETLITLASQYVFASYFGLAQMLRQWALSDQTESEDRVSKMHEALSMVHGAGNYAEAPYSVALMAEAYGRADRPEPGLSLLRETLATTKISGQQYWDAELHRLTGELLLQQEPTDEVEEHFHQAMAISRRQQAKSLELRAAVSLARLWRGQGRQKDAQELLIPIYGWFTEGFDTGDLRDARALLKTL